MNDRKSSGSDACCYVARFQSCFLSLSQTVYVRFIFECRQHIKLLLLLMLLFKTKTAKCIYKIELKRLIVNNWEKVSGCCYCLIVVVYL
jgi:hypothetical protein